MENRSELNLDHRWDKYEESIEGSHLFVDIGKVTEVTGMIIKGFLPGAAMGCRCTIYSQNGQNSFLAEIVGFNDTEVKLMPLGSISGVGYGSKLVLLDQKNQVKVGNNMLGRVINALGQPLDTGGSMECQFERELYPESINPLSRRPIFEPLYLGVRAIDGLISVGRGQRVGIMAGSGVGKSILLGNMARRTEADVNVIALIGERGREVREFIEKNLGEEGLKKSVVVVVSSDESPLLRIQGAFMAATIAEHFSEQGKDVLFMMDSVTRLAMAQREVGLSVGEPPTAKGYPPSVYSLLPKLFERAGLFEDRGSITGLFTVLAEGDDMDDPIVDSVRSIVDGHIILDRNIAQRGHFPAIDVLQSTSRVMNSIVDADHLAVAQSIRKNLAVYRDAEDLIQIGAYNQGNSEEIDEAIRVNGSIMSFLREDLEEEISVDHGTIFGQMAQAIG